MWQEIVIIIIVVAAFGKAGWSIYRFFKRPKHASPCDNCAGCQLKDVMKNSKETCDDYKKKEISRK